MYCLAEEERRRIAEQEEKARQRRELEDNAKKALVVAMHTRSLEALSGAIEDAMQLGLQNDELELAKTMRGKLQVFEECQSRLTAAVNVISTRGPGGVSATDKANLDAAVAFAESADLPSDWIEPALMSAKEEQAKMQKQIDIKSNLSVALESGDRLKLRTALNSAENLDMQEDIVDKAKLVLKEAEVANREKLAKEDAMPVATDFDEQEKARELRYEIARQARFDIKNYPSLRSPDDFAKGILLTKTKVKEGMLVWSGSVIPRSLVDMSKDQNKVAIQMFKDLLGYMGDKQMPFPAMLAQDILRKGFDQKNLRDEIFIQVLYVELS